jgi:hypothetical protein
MKRISSLAAVFALAAIAAAGKPKIKDSVTYATSWESAVEEAKLLNVPIVVHSHGFY